MTLKKPLLGEDDNSPFPLFGALGALGGIIGRRKRRRKGRKMKMPDDPYADSEDTPEDERVERGDDDDKRRGGLFGGGGIFGFLRGGGKLKDWAQERERRKGEKSGALRRLWETKPWLPF